MFNWIGIITAGLWPFVWHMGTATIAMLACAAWAIWGPFWKSQAVWAGIAIFLTTSAYIVGVKDEKHRWEATIAADRAQADKAARDADSMCVTADCVRNDRNNRDR